MNSLYSAATSTFAAVFLFHGFDSPVLYIGYDSCSKFTTQLDQVCLGCGTQRSNVSSQRPTGPSICVQPNAMCARCEWHAPSASKFPVQQSSILYLVYCPMAFLWWPCSERAATVHPKRSHMHSTCRQISFISQTLVRFSIVVERCNFGPSGCAARSARDRTDTIFCSHLCGHDDCVWISLVWLHRTAV